MMAHANPITSFLSHRRLAFVGLSRDPHHFSRALFRDLAQRGYDVVPVNPAAREVDGRACFARLQEVEPAVEAALIMTPAELSAGVVRDCVDAHVHAVWLHRGAGQGAVSEEALALCREHGIEVVPGACPYMFLPGSGWVHALHGFVLRVLHRRPV